MNPEVYENTTFCAVVTHRDGEALSRPEPVPRRIPKEVVSSDDTPSACDALARYLLESHPQINQHDSGHRTKFYPQTEYTD